MAGTRIPTKDLEALVNWPLGESFTLAASSARGATAGTNGTAVDISGRSTFALLIEFTAKATESSDTCDVYVDMYVAGTWVNAVHFTQALGNGTDAAKEYAILMQASATAPIDATSDADSGAVRPTVLGSQIRARWIIVDGGGSAASFTFSVVGWAL